MYYSRESYLALPESVDDLIESVIFGDKIECEIQQALKRYSLIIFEALKVFSFLHNKNQANFSEKDLSQCLKIPDNACLLNDDLKMDEVIFGLLNDSVNAYVEHHSSFITDDEEYRQHLASLKEREITPETALFFINGHIIEDKVVRPLMLSVIKSIKKKETIKIHANYSGQQVQERQNQIRNHFKENCNLDTLLFQCKAFQNRGITAWDALIQQLHKVYLFH